MAGVQNHQEYIQSRVNPVLESLVTQLLLERPDDPVPFMIKWLSDQAKLPVPKAGDAGEVDKLKSEVEQLRARIAELEAGGAGAPSAANEASDEEEEEDDDDDDVVDEMPEIPVSYTQKGPRQSVSAEAYGQWNQKKDFEPPVFPKTEEQKRRIRGVLEQSFLFASLEEKDFGVVIDAMVEKNLEPKTRIIYQGDDGDVLFVVEEGTLDCYKKFSGEDEEKLVKVVSAGDAFGELALLYNCPRAASVESRDECVLWQLDRETFNHIVKDAAAKKREVYENFLKKVQLLESMDQYERAKLADALKTEMYKSGEVIVKRGDPGDRFFIVEEGECVATKSFVDGQLPQEVMHYKEGDYFGELALLRNEPRAANVTAKGDVKVLSLDRRSFKRLLGPLEDILKRNTTRYN